MEEEGTDSVRLLPEWQNHPALAYHERAEFEPAVALMPTARAYVNAFLSLSRLYTLFTTDTAAGPAVSG
ncbi:hypothetical protein ALC57_11235 [Trachymyrmex cornetzi]|uniref:Uncharacterized protein n=1 Tax=Trachymyrmex cornetzi TaxID=471704 RepID=A0A195DUI7_9HYME|nr:hypothetical protein ALC57_11235 [Trachymyrmex cornetzi]